MLAHMSELEKAQPEVQAAEVLVCTLCHFWKTDPVTFLSLIAVPAEL